MGGVLAAAALAAATLPVTTARADGGLFGSGCEGTDFAVVEGGTGVFVGFHNGYGQEQYCILFGSPATGMTGGIVTVPNWQVTLPTTDDLAWKCQYDSGYLQLVNASSGGLQFTLSVATPSNGPEICIDAFNTYARLQLTAGVGAPPQVTFTPYSGPDPFAVPMSWPTTGPSSTCGAPQLYVASEQQLENLWVATSGSSVCVRYEGHIENGVIPTTVGGRLDATLPQVSFPSSSPNPCYVNLFTLSAPVQASVSTSAPGVLPQEVCITLPGGTPVNTEVGSPVVVSGPSWNPDPDSAI